MQAGTKRTLGTAVALAIGIVWAAGCQEGATPGDKNTQVQQTNSNPAPAATTPAETPAVANNTPPAPSVQTPPPAEQPAPAETHRTATRTTTRTAPRSETHAEVTPRRTPVDVTVAAGTVIDTQLQTAVATNTNKVGDNVTLQTTESVIVNGVVAIPVGSTVHGTVTELRGAGRIKGASLLTLRFTDVEFSNGRRFPMTCEAFHVEEKGDGKETAAEIGGGSAVGGVLGSVIGGKHSTLKGAAIGAAVGTAVAGATKGTQIQLPVGKNIQVQLTAPVVISNVAS